MSIYSVLGQTSDGFLLDNYIISEDLYENVTVIGLGALIANGLSYYPLAGNLTILSSCKEYDDFFSGIYLYQYIEGYNTVIGFKDNLGVPTPERAICDCILYDRWSIYLYEGLIEYLKNREIYNKDRLIKTALKLGISKQRILEELRDAQEMMY